jgi:hypothetical protein
MRQTQHPSNNDVLGAPPGVAHDQCSALAITRAVYADGTAVVLSYWEPTEEERKAIAAGAKVCFSCWGQTHPPVWIGVDGVGEAPKFGDAG